MTEILQLTGLIGLAIVLTIKEVFNSNGRDKLHRRINKVYDDMEAKMTTKELCDERSGHIQGKLNSIESKVDKLIRYNGIK